MIRSRSSTALLLSLASLLGGCGGSSTNSSTDDASPRCGPGTVWCSGECVAAEYAPSECFSAPPPEGDGGADAASCAADAGPCNGACADLANDPANCGACGHACASGAACASGQCVEDRAIALPFSFLDAEYSRAIDDVVLVSTAPSALHLLDPHSGQDVALPLPAEPTCVSLAPDGAHAAVGYDGFVSYVDLTTRSIVGTYAVSAPVGDLVLAGNGYAYALPSSDQWVALHVLDLATGREVTAASYDIYAGSRGRATHDGRTLFVTDGLSPSSVTAFDISDGAMPMQKMMHFGSDYPSCNRAWVSRDDARVFTGCGHIFHTADLSYAGSFAGAMEVVSVDDEASDGEIAVLVAQGYAADGASEMATFDPQYVSPKATRPLPPLHAPGGLAPALGRFVFHDAAGAATVVLLHGRDPVSHADVYGYASF